MIKSKYLGKILTVLMVLAVAFTIALTYFQKEEPVAVASDVEVKSYETEIFNKNEVMTVDIKMDQDTWKAMLANASTEEYVLCDVVVNGTTYKDVGIRAKGNTSLSQIVSDETSDRFSFKIEFDQYVKNQNCYGLDKLVLNNMMSDSTYMKEYLAYDMMDFMGVATPLYSYASISVNGESWGFYLALEGLEESFAERNYGEDYGKLYKPESTNIGGAAMGGVKDAIDKFEFKDNISRYLYQDQTVLDDRTQIGGGKGNMEDFLGNSAGGTDLLYVDNEINSYSAIFDSAVFNSDNTDYKRVIKALKNISKGKELEKNIDVEATLRYFAVNTVLVNFDSYVGSLKHNYYLYEEKGQLSMLPWDFNLAFAGFQTNDASSAVNSPIDTPVSGTTLSERPILGKLLEVDEYMDLYHSYLQEIMTDYFASGLFENTITSLNTLISDYVENDKTALYTFDEYKAGVDTLTKFGLLRAESIQGQLNGTIPTTETDQNGKPDSLIDATGIDISAMGTQGGGNMGGGPGNIKGAFGGNGGNDGNDIKFQNNSSQKFSGNRMGGRNNRNQKMDSSSLDTNINNNSIILLISVIFLILGLIFIKYYHRKKYIS